MTLPDQTRIGGELLREWVVEPTDAERPTVEEVLAAVEIAARQARSSQRSVQPSSDRRQQPGRSDRQLL